MTKNIPAKITPDAGRGRSTIGFPYLYLDDSIEIAQIVKVLGGASCEVTKIAKKLDAGLESGAFRIRLNTASKLFGLITYDNEQAYLTKLGNEILDPSTEKDAKRQAFLRVQLYKSMVDEYMGQTPPSAEVIERRFVDYGVAPKQRDKARRAFLGSLKQAGLIDIATGLISMTPENEVVQSGVQNPINVKEQNASHIDDASKKIHPLLKGLMESLKETGTEFSIEERIVWTQTALQIFNFIYTRKTGEESDSVEVVRKKV